MPGRINDTEAPAQTVWTLDMNDFRHGSEQQRLKFSASLVNCLASQGFVKVINHAVPPVAMKNAFEWNRKFFDLPEAAKAKCPHPACANPNRGWSALGQEKSSAIKDFEKGSDSKDEVWDVKEAFDMGPSDDPLYENMWPESHDLPGFRTFMETFYELCHEAHMDILRALELVLDKPDHPFKVRDICMPNVSELRLNYYPEVDLKEMKSGRVSRISEHTDFGTVTLLFQDGVGGLEIENQSKPGEYFGVECENESVMLVNIGDSLQRLTNDVLTSCSHRVHVPISAQEADQGALSRRYSIAYFAKVHRDQSIKPMPRFVSETHPAKYPDMSAFEWNQLKLSRIYGVC